MLIAITLAALGFLGALTFQGWLLLHLRGQQARLDGRLDLLARRAADPQGSAAIAAPAFALPDLNGRTVTSAELLAPAKPLVLVFADPRCGPCYELLPDVGGWQRVYGDRLTIALISGGTPAANRAMTAEYGIAAGSVLLQTANEAVTAFGIGMAPAAVVVRPDGRLAGEAALGAPAVRQLVADTLGLKLAPPPAQEIRAARPGEPAPRFRRPDLDGNVVELVSDREEATLLLFWNPGCHHCQELLPQLREWEARPFGPRLLVVSRGPVALIRDAGVRSSMILDDDRSLAEAFGVTGTPAAVLIDARGVIAAEVARGAAGVRSLAERCFATEAAPAA